MTSTTDIPRRESQRRCTDILWLVIFFLLLAFMIFIGAFALVYGKPQRLISGYDSFGNVCGSANKDMANKSEGGMQLSGYDATELRYAFLFNVLSPHQSLRVCVKECPDRTLEKIEDIHDFYNRTGSNLCRYDYDSYLRDMGNFSLPNGRISLIRDQLCPTLPIYHSKPLLNYCVPLQGEGPVGYLYDLYGYLNSLDFLEQVLADLYASWQYILGFIFLSFVLSLVLMMVLHCFTSCLGYFILAFVALVSIGATVLLWWGFASVHLQLDSSPLDQVLEETARNERALLSYAIVSTIICVILLILSVYVCKRVKVISELFHHAGRCLAQHPTLLLQPFITFTVLLAFFAIWMWVLVSLATARHLKSSSLTMPLHTQLSNSSNLSSDALSLLLADSRNGTGPSVSSWTILEYADPAWVRSLWWVWLIGLIWVSEFILACQQMIIAGAVSQWYFASHSNVESINPVSSSWRKLVCYHLGTVAKGSFLITLFKVPRLIVQWLSKKFKMHTDNRCISCLSKTFGCCMYLFEQFLKYMNHNAYTVTATRGTNFCTSAKIAWRVVFTNMLGVATLNSIGDLVIFLAKCGVTATVCGVALLVLQHDEALHLYAVPLLTIAVFAFFVTHCVFSVYEMALDSLFLCFYDDYNMYDSTDGKELVAGKELYEFMIKHEDIDSKKRGGSRPDKPETIRFEDRG